MRLGILGGTFDPPHTGHLIVAQDALTALSLDRIIFLPAGQPPHKEGVRVTDAATRLELVTAAIAGDSRFEVDARELDRPGPSWTVDTLRAYRAERADAELFLLIGTDQHDELHTWRAVDEIRTLARIVVLSRSGGERSDPASTGDVAVPVTRIDLSSTMIRQRVRAGQPIRYLVPPRVEGLIRALGLYGE